MTQQPPMPCAARTPEDFDRVRRYIDTHQDRDPETAAEMHTALCVDALLLIARGNPFPEALAQAALGARLLDGEQQ